MPKSNDSAMSTSGSSALVGQRFAGEHARLTIRQSDHHGDQDRFDVVGLGSRSAFLVGLPRTIIPGLECAAEAAEPI